MAVKLTSEGRIVYIFKIEATQVWFDYFTNTSFKNQVTLNLRDELRDQKSKLIKRLIID